VYAYDINRDAIRFCRRMAELNHVSHRLITGSICDTRALLAIPFTKKVLILSDCEGYEKHLFTATVVAELCNHDFLIEVHDFIDIEISSVIRERFERTHDISVIQSIDDIKKAHIYKYPELERFTLGERRRLLAEYRPHTMEWFFMTPHPV
jgi:tRNA G37 N-methylase Trm5